MVLTVEAIFVLQHGQRHTDTHRVKLTDTIQCFIHATATASMGNEGLFNANDNWSIEPSAHAK